MSSLEKRIKKLEEAVFGSARDRKKHWESTVGRFKDDPLMKEIVDDALEAREQERAESRCGSEAESE